MVFISFFLAGAACHVIWWALHFGAKECRWLLVTVLAPKEVPGSKKKHSCKVAKWEETAVTQNYGSLRNTPSIESQLLRNTHEFNAKENHNPSYCRKANLQRSSLLQRRKTENQVHNSSESREQRLEDWVRAMNNLQRSSRLLQREDEESSLKVEWEPWAQVRRLSESREQM